MVKNSLVGQYLLNVCDHEFPMLKQYKIILGLHKRVIELGKMYLNQCLIFFW